MDLVLEEMKKQTEILKNIYKTQEQLLNFFVALEDEISGRDSVSGIEYLKELRNEKISNG